MSQKLDANKQGLLYRGMLDCFAKTLKAEGLLAFWKGCVVLFESTRSWLPIELCVSCVQWLKW